MPCPSPKTKPPPIRLSEFCAILNAKPGLIIMAFTETNGHPQMEALLTLISEGYDYKYLKALVAKTGLEGVGPKGPTPMDVTLKYLGHILKSLRQRQPNIGEAARGTKVDQGRVEYTHEFMSWLLTRGAIPRTRYMSSICENVKYSFKYKHGYWRSPSLYSTDTGWLWGDFIADTIQRTVDMLSENGVPIELDTLPLPHDWPSWVLKPDNILAEFHVVDEPELGFSPLHLTAAWGSVDVCQHLISKGATVDVRSTFGLTPLMVACGRGHLEAAEALLDAGADVALEDIHGRTPITIKEQFCGQFKPEITDALQLRLRYSQGSIIRPDQSYRSDGLVHRTARGDLVRSKTEVIIADALFYLGCSYEYEKPLLTRNSGHQIIPDFTITNAATGKTVIWEHAGMMGDPSYRKRWRKKEAWYERNGYERDKSLFVTLEDDESGIDSHMVRKTAMTIKSVLEGKR